MMDVFELKKLILESSDIGIVTTDEDEDIPN